MAVRPRRRSARPGRGGGGGDDRLSALPDELLLIVLRGLDTRSALGAAALSRRWARLPRELPALDFRVSDALPPAYHRRAADLGLALANRGKLEASLARYERRVMRGLTESITNFLDADDGLAAAGNNERRRRVRRLGVEFFATDDRRRVDCVHRLVDTAVGRWGVEELDVAVKPAPWRRRKVHYFSIRRLDVEGSPPPRLAKLTLRNCPPAMATRHLIALKTMILHDLPPSTKPYIYASLFSSAGFLHLKRLHLKNCHSTDMFLKVDALPPAPVNTITELVVERCSFIFIELRDAAAALEDLACINDGPPVHILFGNGNAPRHLRRVHLSFSVTAVITGINDEKHNLGWSVGSQHMKSLVVLFTGRRGGSSRNVSLWTQQKNIDGYQNNT